MRLIIFDRLNDNRINFHPAALGRPIFELRCGMTSLADKLISKVGIGDVAYFVPPYMAEAYQASTDRPVNDPASLEGGDLLLANARVKPEGLDAAKASGASRAAVDENGELLWARVAAADCREVRDGSFEELLAAAERLPKAPGMCPAWRYIWELILETPTQLIADFQAAGRHGIEGIVEEPFALRGAPKHVYIARGAIVHPMAVIDVENGPIYIDEGAVVHPFTRIEGPCYLGKNSVLLGCKCREGNSIGPMCRLGGEVGEEGVEAVADGDPRVVLRAVGGPAGPGQTVVLAGRADRRLLPGRLDQPRLEQAGQQRVDGSRGQREGRLRGQLVDDLRAVALPLGEQPEHGEFHDPPADLCGAIFSHDLMVTPSTLFRKHLGATGHRPPANRLTSLDATTTQEEGPMSEEKKDGGDISSGFGDPKVDGPVSDEKAEQMLHGGNHDDVTEEIEIPTELVFAVDSDGTVEVEDADEQGRPDAAGGGGGGGW